jgi:antitoxin component of MazEF toxin-antitoxin module
MATSKKKGATTFDTTLSSFGNNTGIEVPVEVIEALGGGQRPPVQVDVNGYAFRTTVGVMSGKHLVPISAAIRKATGLQAGDAIHVTLTLDTTPRAVDVPADLAAALAAHPPARAFFDKLSNSLQRYHVDNVTGAKAADTRRRRIEKAIELFLAGKQR